MLRMQLLKMALNSNGPAATAMMENDGGARATTGEAAF